MKNQLFILWISLGLLLSIVVIQPVRSSPLPPGKEIPDIYSPGNSQPPSITNITICNNQFPYLWNGINCLTAGTYTVTLTGSSGTDSTAILNLSVNNVGISISNAVICDNQLPYTWNGNSYSASGTYSVTLTSSNGCDSVPILSLTVNHIVSSTTNVNICSDQLPYSWNGNSYPAVGSYNVTLTSVAGCDSIATLQLATRPVTGSISNTTICASQLPYHWNGNVYPVAGNYQFTLNGSNGCDSIASLNLSTIPTGTSVTSISVCSNQLPYTWNGQQYTLPGNHAVSLTAASGCDSIATLILSVKPVTQSNTVVTICTVQLPYTWNGNTYPATGIYSITLTGSSGCDSIANLYLTAIPVLSSSTNTTICNSLLPYTWNGNNYITGGTYTSSFITTAGCDSIASLVLTVVTPQVGTEELTLCSNELPYTWNGHTFSAAGSYPVVPPVIIDACHTIDSVSITINTVLPGYTNAMVCNNQLPYIWNGNTYTVAGTYSVNLTSTTGCDSIAILNLAVNPVVSSTTNTAICSNQLPYSWNGSNYNSSGTYIKWLTSTPGCDSVVILNLLVNPVQSSTTNTIICNAQLPYTWNGNIYNSSGIYIVTLNSSSGCDSVATLNLGAQPFLTSTTNLPVCNNQLPYTWNGNIYPAAGTYSVTLQSSGGCDSIATLNLLVNNVMTGDTTINICNTQLPYTWNGNTFTSAGNYTVLLTSTGGCDSAATIHLLVNTVVTSTTTTTICNNQLPYSWNGNSYPVGGTYPVTLTGSGGCDSIAILQLLVTDILTSSSNVSVCNAQLPYLWNANSYASPGTYSVTLSSPGGCDSVPVLILTVVPFVSSTTNVLVCSNDLPYSWNGNSYSSTGTYTATLVSSAGCDSLATLNLASKPVATSTSSIIKCSNQLPFNWNGNNYTSAGIYQATLTGSNGCDSIATLNLVVNLVSSSNRDISICSDQLPYSWNGNNYQAAGTYAVTLTGSTGCDSVAWLALHVKQRTYSTTNDTTCSNQLPYSWNGQQYVAGGVHIVHLVNAAGCDSVATLNLTVSQVVSSNSNAFTCSNQLPYNWNGQSYTTAGIHTVILVSSAGCDSIVSLDLTINPVTTSLTQVNTCANQLPYSWNGQLYITTGIYSAFLTGLQGCDSIAKLKLVVHPVDSSTTRASVCSAQLPYNWNGQSYTTAGIHTVILQSSAGCDSIAKLDLAIQGSPSMPSVISPVVYCQYATTIPLTANLTDTSSHLLWYSTATGGNGSVQSPIPSSLSAGSTNYYVSQLSGVCEGPRTLITVLINNKPSFPDRSVRICFGTSANLSGEYQTTGHTTTWTYNGSPVANPVATTVPGIYQLVSVNASGCSDTALVNLSMQPPVIANAGNDADVEYNIPYQLTGTGGGSYQWSPTGSLNNSQVANPAVTINSNTSFILMVQDEIGCRAFDTVNLRVLNGPTFYVPTAFTPNGDGLNDIFRPTPVGISSLDYFRVYNRYGELVYETNELGKGWDGMYKGVKQNTGNFVWWVKGTDRKGQDKLLRGNVVLIR